jgi:hypothetical protein
MRLGALGQVTTLVSRDWWSPSGLHFVVPRHSVAVVQIPTALTFPYEYVSGVARLNRATWGVEIYLVNRGATEAMGRAYVIEALGATQNGIFGNKEKFNSGNQVVPRGDYAFISYQPSALADFGLYWCRIVTTSRDLVPSVSFYRPTDDEPAGTVPDFAFALGDFAVFSPSSVPLIATPSGGTSTTSRRTRRTSPKRQTTRRKK